MQSKFVLYGIATILIVSVAAYGVYLYTNPTPSPPGNSNTSNNTVFTPVNITDYYGRNVTISSPVKRIVCLNSGFTEIICAMGGESLIVGRESYSTFPASMQNVTVVGTTSWNVNVELVLELEPDLIISDIMIHSEDLTRFEEANITTIIEYPADLTRVQQFMSYMAQILKTPKASALISWMNQYVNLVDQRLQNLTASEMPKFYFEFVQPYMAYGSGSRIGQLVKGGINIVNSTSDNTKVSAEFVLEQNPDVVLLTTYSPTQTYNEEFFQSNLAAFQAREGLSNLAAVQSGRVYLFSYTLLQGMRIPVGMLFFAKCMQPDRFSDIDVNNVLRDLYRQFFDYELQGIYVYP
ncbi:MAG: ABC transporter substrate-binding protein [Candidatus Verstraetearchaeota archaeon]|nr:ABC transporter substrate-binding protein [Candidatus Verstraetearchaeota archaeon]